MKSSTAKSHEDSQNKSQATLTCFISAPYNIDLRRIVALLEKKGIKPLMSADMTVGSPITEYITEAIAKADLFIGVLGPTLSNANVYFELGYAYSKGKRILVIAPPTQESIPSDLIAVPYLRVNKDNDKAIEIALDQIIAAPKSSKQKVSPITNGSQPIGARADEFISTFESIVNVATEAEIQRLLVSALEASKIPLVAEYKAVGQIVDLAVWSDDLSFFGNPFLIEIKRDLCDQNQVAEMVDSLEALRRNANVRVVLVIYLTASPNVLKIPQVLNSMILFIEIHELFENLRKKSFGQIIRELRNNRVHRVDR